MFAGGTWRRSLWCPLAGRCGVSQQTYPSGASVQSEQYQLRRPSIEGGSMQYDVVIIGAGAAGSVLGSRLGAEAHTPLLLLGAGAGYPDPPDLPGGIKFGHTTLSAAPDAKNHRA